MNRICVFLSNEIILNSLLEKTQNTIKINEHIIPIRRLLNPAKRIIISNVCPSIPNQTILDALKQINITPISEINYLKAGIKEIGYEHILSFRRQIYIKHEDIPKLPGTLLININETNFRLFFTDDTITCFTCKLTGHTSMSCKKNTTNNKNITQQPNHLNNPTQQLNVIEDHNILMLENIQPPESPLLNEQHIKNQMDWSDESLYPSLNIKSPNQEIMQQHYPVSTIEDCSQNLLNIETNGQSIVHDILPDQNIKRPISETTSQKSSSSPKSTQQPDKKKVKVLSRSNSLTNLNDTNDDINLKITEPFFSSSENNSSITYLQFKYIIENFGNKHINIHSLCENIDSNITTILETIEKIRPYIKDRSMKTKLTKLGNLLFKSQPPQGNSENL